MTNHPDFDFDQFVRMMDIAFTSQDPRVVDTLRRLLMVVALTQPAETQEDKRRAAGPMQQTLEKVKNLEVQLKYLESQMRQMSRFINGQVNHSRDMDPGALGARVPGAPNWDVSPWHDYDDRYRMKLYDTLRHQTLTSTTATKNKLEGI